MSYIVSNLTFYTCTLCVIWKAIPFCDSTHPSETRSNVIFLFKISSTKTKPSFLWTSDQKQPNLLLPRPNLCVFLSCSLSLALGSGRCVKMEAKGCSWENWVKILGTRPSSLRQCSLSPWEQILFLIFLFYPLQCLIPRSALKYKTKLTTTINNSWWLTVLSGQSLSPTELASLQIFWGPWYLMGMWGTRKSWDLLTRFRPMSEMAIRSAEESEYSKRVHQGEYSEHKPAENQQRCR